jgi:cytochrome c551/c552
MSEAVFLPGVIRAAQPTTCADCGASIGAGEEIAFDEQGCIICHWCEVKAR